MGGNEGFPLSQILTDFNSIHRSILVVNEYLKGIYHSPVNSMQRFKRLHNAVYNCTCKKYYFFQVKRSAIRNYVMNMLLLQKTLRTWKPSRKKK